MPLVRSFLIGYTGNRTLSNKRRRRLFARQFSPAYRTCGSVSPNVQFRLGLTLMDDPYLFLLFMLLFLLDGLYEARNRDSGE